MKPRGLLSSADVIEGFAARALREKLRRVAADRKHWCAEEALEALRRLDDGTYGTCTKCGLAISERRLRARPEATRCLDCQSVRD